MNILVDADACPVKNQIEKIAISYNIPVYMFVDTSHIIISEYSTIITVDKCADSVDLAIIGKLQKGDLVVTGDYGLAVLVLSKRGFAISQNGFLYTDKNIDMLLFERHLGKENRMRGKYTNKIKKRVKQDNDKFEKQMIEFIKSKIKKQFDN